ncbi:hypothetical protein AB0M95_07990 [Sphaerisporangium sp. NPDC051017]|uniref:hypothetical protein n=1 Tax=Sphaerisporangium sp. NPDC051017 TaxID=3154636 RepID=UPI00342C0D2D
MASKDLVRARFNRNDGMPTNKEGFPQTTKAQQYHHLVTLAWELSRRGLRAVVDLPLKTDPVLVVPRTASAVRVMACLHRGTWLYTWGRGSGQRVPVTADDAADRVWEVAQ